MHQILTQFTQEVYIYKELYIGNHAYTQVLLFIIVLLLLLRLRFRLRLPLPLPLPPHTQHILM